jgi:hypothetical protein
MIEGLNAVSSNGLEMLPSEMKSWLRRALQVDAERSFATAVDAKADFDKTIKINDARSRTVLTAFLSECQTFGKGSAAAASAPAAESKPKEQRHRGLRFVANRAEGHSGGSQASGGQEGEGQAGGRGTEAFHASAGGVRLQPASPKKMASLQVEEGPVLAVRVAESSGGCLPQFLVAIVTAGVFAIKSYARVPPTGELVVNTNPDGVEVFIDGKKRGSTPITLELPTGDHKLELTLGDQTRAIPVKITTGGHVAQFVELPKVAAVVGQLSVRTDPPGATVTVDGQRRGVSPLVVEDLAPGEHSVGLQNALSSVTERVTVQAGTTASLVVPLSAPQGVPVSGWVSLTSPIEMQLFEDGASRRQQPQRPHHDVRWRPQPADRQ